MNRFSKSILLATTVCASAVLPTTTTFAEVSANVAFSSDYRFRGISQNDKSFAVSGGFDYENESGFYAGLWASSVDFQVQTVDDASTELDIYAGFGGSFGDSGVGYDINVLHFAYPDADSSLNYEFTEVTFGLSYEMFSFSYSVTDDYFAASGNAEYANLSMELPINDNWGFAASVGSQSVDDNSAWGTPDWMDYKLAVSGELFGGVGVEVAYIDTDLSESECFGGSDWCDGTVVLSFSKSL